MRVFSKDKDSATNALSATKIKVDDTNEEELSDIILQYSIKQGYCDVVALLLQKCKTVDLNKTLINACKNNAKDVVPVLMQFGADAIQESLEIACECGNIESVQLLITHQLQLWDNDEDINTKRVFMNKGLAHACIRGSTELVALLIKHGADDLIRALYIASENRNADVVNCLVQLSTEKWLNSSVNRYSFEG
jgi:ankyrin repeat protein